MSLPPFPPKWTENGPAQVRFEELLRENKVTRTTKPNDLTAFDSRFKVYSNDVIRSHMTATWSKKGGQLAGKLRYMCFQFATLRSLILLYRGRRILGNFSAGRFRWWRFWWPFFWLWRFLGNDGWFQFEETTSIGTELG